jgi:hypothetical protein
MIVKPKIENKIYSNSRMAKPTRKRKRTPSLSPKKSKSAKRSRKNPSVIKRFLVGGPGRYTPMKKGPDTPDTAPMTPGKYDFKDIDLTNGNLEEYLGAVYATKRKYSQKNKGRLSRKRSNSTEKTASLSTAKTASLSTAKTDSLSTAKTASLSTAKTASLSTAKTASLSTAKTASLSPLTP